MRAIQLSTAIALFLLVTGCTQPGVQQAGAGTPTYDGETADFGVAPTTVIRTTDFEAATPVAVAGATTITTTQLQQMLASPKPPILIDVLGGDVTASIPGAIWLRRGGFGSSLDDGLQKRLGTKLAALTNGDKSTPIAFFCLSRTCWLSHNTAVRAVALGYTNVLWYRGGRNAWTAAGLSLQPVKPTDL